MTYRSPSHMWADHAALPDAPAFVAGAAMSTRAAVDALAEGRDDLAGRLWSSVNGVELLRLWNVPIEMPGREARRPDPAAVARPSTPRARPSRTVSERVFARDGYRCSYCDIPVVTQWKNGDAPQLVAAFPTLTPSLSVVNGSLIGGGKNGALRNVDTAKWLWFVAVVDHVVPAGAGGSSDLDNLVTACGGCNYTKMDFTLDQLDIAPPGALTGNAGAGSR